MGAVILLIFMGLVVLIGLGMTIFGSDADVKAPGGVLATLGLLGAVLFTTFGGMQTVPVKSIGVPQAFGTVSGGTMGSGIHWTFQPWMSVAIVDETVQTTTFEGNNCLQVRIGGQQTACADATIQWQILPEAAEGLYKDYANHGNLEQTVTDAVVVREFKQVVNATLGDYNPITDVQNVSGSNTASSQFTQFGPQILAAMRKDIGDRIEVKSVFLPKITYDQAVESALQKIQTANANYAIATENVKVNQAQAQAFANLGTPNLSQLVAQCLTDLRQGMNAPVGFQCIPSSGSGLALSVGASK